MSEKHKSTSPSAIQVKNWQETINIEEELGEISPLEKSDHTVDMPYVRLAHNSIHTIHDNVNPLTPGKYNIFSGNFVFDLCEFDLHYVFQECVPGIKQDLPV
jgi:hypothetical protein